MTTGEHPHGLIWNDVLGWQLPRVDARPLAPEAHDFAKAWDDAVSIARRFPLRLLIVGHGRHGKDTVGEIIRDRYGARFVSSSWFTAEHVVLPLFPPGQYASVQACYDDRANYRSFWFDAIAAYNKDDATTLGRAIFAEYDLYVGNRNARELHAMRNAGVMDAAIWVDACERLEYREPRSSLTIEPWMCDYIVDNNGTPAELERNVCVLVDRLLGIRSARQDAVTRSWASAALSDRQA